MKLRRGLEVIIEFLDHSQDAGRLIPFRVRGTVTKANKTEIEVRDWEYVNAKDRRELGRGNETYYNIARATVTGAYRVIELEKLEL